jgi:hypothetical protein
MGDYRRRNREAKPEEVLTRTMLGLTRPRAKGVPEEFKARVAALAMQVALQIEDFNRQMSA